MSGQGVGLNEFVNSLGQGTTLMSDGDEHRRQREIIGRPLTPRASPTCGPTPKPSPTRSSTGSSQRRRFDAVADLAEILPATWVPDLLGWPDEGRDHLLDWAAANFDGLGPAQRSRRRRPATGSSR